MTEPNELQALLTLLEGASSILLICHVSPDGDTLGSALALRERLLRMGKAVELGVDGDVPYNCRMLPEWQSVQKPEDCKACELALCVDVSSPDRMGAMQLLFDASRKTALIDHHPTNPAFAGRSVIDGDAPATALVVWRMFRMQKLALTQSEAVNLYAALSTDTGNFVYESTNSECFLMMSELMQAGLPLAHYSRLLFRQKALPFVRLLALSLSTLEVSADGRLAGLSVMQEQLASAGATADHTDGLVDYAIDLDGVRLAYFLREGADGTVKASLRALEPYRVDQVASGFGGGGHRLAAGCTLHMSMPKAREAIKTALTKAQSEVSE